MSSRPGTQSAKQTNKQNQNQKRKQPQQTQQQAQQQTQAASRPKPNAAQAQALAAQEAAKRDARLQRQAEARAEAARRKRAQNLRTYGIVAAVAIVLLALVAWLSLRDAGKPGERVDIMAVRNHIAPGEGHVPYSTDPPTSGPHVGSVPAFSVYTSPITKELQVHGLEDGGVVINYKPDLDKPTVDKLASLAQFYEKTPGKTHVIMSPYPSLSNAIVLTSWGRIDRLDAFDEARIRRFIDEYVNIDHHETSEGQRIP